MAMTIETFLDGRVTLHCGDSFEILKSQPDCSVDSCVTDPPYALVSITKRFGAAGAAPVVVPEGGSGAYARASGGFMGQKWDTGDTAHAVAFWAEVYRVLKPGGFVLASSGTRTYHRLACAIEDAGFEIRDMISWLYGSGFPKSHDVGKGIDKAAGAKREVVGLKPKTGGGRAAPSHEGWRRPWMEEDGAGDKPFQITTPATEDAAAWDGWGTALKPACEPIVMARKPLVGTVAENVLEHGTGAINVDACRVQFSGYGDEAEAKGKNRHSDFGSGPRENAVFGADNRPRGANGNYNPPGRWPANVVHDGSDEVVEAFPETETNAGILRSDAKQGDINYAPSRAEGTALSSGNSGSAARFFYTAKADSDDRLGSKHPTVKPVDLMQWLVRLVTPKGGLVLDPFAGTGTTAEACFREGMRCMLIEREAPYQEDIRRRMRLVLGGPDERRRESIKAKTKDQVIDLGPLFSTTA